MYRQQYNRYRWTIRNLFSWYVSLIFFSLLKHILPFCVHIYFHLYQIVIVLVLCISNISIDNIYLQCLKIASVVWWLVCSPRVDIYSFTPFYSQFIFLCTIFVYAHLYFLICTFMYVSFCFSFFTLCTYWPVCTNIVLF